MFFKKRRSRKLAVILGARPNFVKAAPFLREAKKHPRFQITVIHTGQHFDANMSKVFFDELGLPAPDIFLDIKGEAHTEKIGKMFDALKLAGKDEKFDAFVVFGDVNSTLAGALAAMKNNADLFHVEAGLRSHDRRMPEEINRVIIDHLSNLLFTSEPSANENLKKEGVKDKKIKYVGNIMIEALEIFRPQFEASNILEKLNLKPKQYRLVTIHRQENTDGLVNLKEILALLAEIADQSTIVFPMHPGTRKQIQKFGLTDLVAKLKTVEPLGYFDFLRLMQQSGGVITDSGGIQEETSHLGVPCATLRDNTERPITLALGTNKLFPIEEAKSEEILSHLNREDFKTGEIPLWDKGVSERIFEAIKLWFA